MATANSSFSDLPIEIRIQIWEYCWEPQVVEICGVKRRPMDALCETSFSKDENVTNSWFNSHDQGRVFTYSTPRTPLHHICRESRCWARDNGIHLMVADVSVEKLDHGTALDRDMVFAARYKRTRRELFDTKNDVLFLQHAGFMFGTFTKPDADIIWDPEDDAQVLSKLRLACPSYTGFDGKSLWDLRYDPSFLELMRLDGYYKGFKPTRCVFSSLRDILDRLGSSFVQKVQKVAIDIFDWRRCIGNSSMGMSLTWLMTFKGLKELLISTPFEKNGDFGTVLHTETQLRQLADLYPEWEKPSVRFASDLGVVTTQGNMFLFPP